MSDSELAEKLRAFATVLVEAVQLCRQAADRLEETRYELLEANETIARCADE